VTQLGAVACGESPGHPEKVDDHRDAEFFGEQNSFAADLAIVLRARLIRMQRLP
jgi:hypothetical protein